MDNTVLYDLSYGMYAVGVKDGMRECGCIVNTVFSGFYDRTANCLEYE